jgi:phosphohistidine phosphatase
MNLYILRHSSAGTRRQNPTLDLTRPLDKEGKQHCLHLAYVLNALKVSFDLVISSPLKRSLQTAQLVATETGYEAEIQHSDALAPEATYQQFQHLLRENADRENLLVVGHSPNIQNFLGAILVPPGEAALPQIRLRKGALARVSYSKGPATLQGLLDPRTVRALYSTSTRSSRRKTAKK